MSQNPYAPMNQPMGHEPQAQSGPAKTSVLAIVALVLSLTICLSPLGLIFGIIAMILIGSSGGRTKGKGLAIAAVLIGLVASVAVVGVIGGGVKMAMGQRSQVQEPVYAALRQLEAGDTTAFRALLAPALASNITDAEILAFRDAYVAECGAFQGEPRDFKSGFAIAGVASNQTLLQKVQTSTGKQPMPIGAVFSNGGGGIILVSDTIAGQTDFLFKSPTLKGTMVNIALALPNTSGVVLTDFIGQNAPPANPPAPAPAAGDQTPPAGNGG